MAKSSGFLSKLKSSLLGKSEKTEESGAGKFAPKKEEPLDILLIYYNYNFYQGFRENHQELCC